MASRCSRSKELSQRMTHICPAVSLTQPQQPEGGKREVGEKGEKEDIQIGGGGDGGGEFPHAEKRS